MRTLLTTLLMLFALAFGPPASAVALETATFGGGCFWCLEAAFEQLKGVDSVVSGYAGGQKNDPTYEEVCRGTTGHAEVVQIRYDPKVITYKDLVRAFFVVHDPTTPNRQGNDVGDQYRSIILTHGKDQAATAAKVVAELGRAKLFPNPILTQVQPLARFFTAEAYHQDYFANHPDQPYCVSVVAPKVEKIRHQYVDRLKKASAPTR